jgi:hypothetical protein
MREFYKLLAKGDIMFLLFLNFFKILPKPKFHEGEVVHFTDDKMKHRCHFFIRKRYWGTPNGDTRKQWVYDGTLSQSSKEQGKMWGIVIAYTDAKGVPEDTLSVLNK